MATVSETITLEVQNTCDNPVQLRWKNRLGGWNYYVFDIKQDKRITTDSTELFRENTKYIETVRTLLSFYKKTGREVWGLFAENITSDHVELLQELSISPKVEMYIGLTGSPALPTYNTVLVMNYDIVLNNNKKRHNVGVTIRLLELETLSNL